MKTFLKFISVSYLIIALTACTGGGGGVTTENDPNQGGGNGNGGGNNGGPSPVFSESLSSFSMVDHEGSQSSNELMGLQFHPIFLAKDTSGKPFTTLSNISVLVMENEDPQTAQEVALTHQGNGIYSANFSSPEPKSYTFRLKIGDSLNQDFLVFQVSACSNNETATPREMTYQSSTYKVICNVAHLQSIQSNLAGLYILGKNIDLSSFYTDTDNDFVPDNQFQLGPAAFTGTLRGLGATAPSISGYRYNGDLALETNLGLFKEIGNGSNVENIKIDQLFISGGSIIGGLAGTISEGASVKNVTVSASLSGDSYLGSIAGKIHSANSKVNLSAVSGELSLYLLSQPVGGNSYIGGLAGEISGNVEILSIPFASLVLYQDFSTTAPITFAGGIAGSIEGSPSPQNLIPKIQDLSVASTNVRIRNGSNIGGIAGRFDNAEFGSSINNVLGSQIAFTLSANINFSPSLNTGLLGGFSGTLSNSTVKNASIFLGTSGSDYSSANPNDLVAAKFSAFSHSISNGQLSNISLYGFNFEINRSPFALFAEEISDSSLERLNISFSDPLIIQNNHSNISLLTHSLLNSSVSRSQFLINTQLDLDSSYISLIGEMDGSSISNSIVSLNISADSEISIITHLAKDSTISNMLLSSTIKANSNVFGVAKEVVDTQISNIAQVSSINLPSSSAAPSNSSLAVQKSQTGDSSSLVNFLYYTEDTQLLDHCLDASCLNSQFTASGESNISYFYNQNNLPYTSWDFNNIWLSDTTFPSLPQLNMQ